MKQTLDKITDKIEEDLPLGQRYALIVFPQGEGRVDLVTNVQEIHELVDRLQEFIVKVLNGETFELPDDEGMAN